MGFLIQLGNKIEKKRLRDQRCGRWKQIPDTHIVDMFQHGNETNEHKKIFKSIIQVGREKKKALNLQ